MHVLSQNQIVPKPALSVARTDSVCIRAKNLKNAVPTILAVSMTPFVNHVGKNMLIVTLTGNAAQAFAGVCQMIILMGDALKGFRCLICPFH